MEVRPFELEHHRSGNRKSGAETCRLSLRGLVVSSLRVHAIGGPLCRLSLVDDSIVNTVRYERLPGLLGVRLEKPPCDHLT